MLVRRCHAGPHLLRGRGLAGQRGRRGLASVVAAAFHPALAPVGVMLAVAGYVLGTYGGLLCAALLEQVHHFIR